MRLERKGTSTLHPPSTKSRLFRNAALLTCGIISSALLTYGTVRAQDILPPTSNATEWNKVDAAPLKVEAAPLRAQKGLHGGKNVARTFQSELPLSESSADLGSPVEDGSEHGAITLPLSNANGILQTPMPAQIKSLADQPINPDLFVGFNRLPLEFEGDMQSARIYQKKYRKMLRRMVRSIEQTLGGAKGDVELAFLDAAWRFYRDSLHAVYGSNDDGFLHESINRRKGYERGKNEREFDCETSVILTHDAGRFFGLEMGIVLLPSGTRFHVVATTPHYFSETTSGMQYPIEVLNLIYPVSFERTTDPKKIQALTYTTRGSARYHRLQFQAAFSDYKKALSLVPNYFTPRINIGWIYGAEILFGLFHKEAEQQFANTIALRPDCPTLYVKEAKYYRSRQNYAKAHRDLDTAIALLKRQQAHYRQDSLEIRWQTLDPMQVLEYQRALHVGRFKRLLEVKNLTKWKGRYFLEQEKPHSALKWLNAAYAIGQPYREENVDVYYQMGNAYDALDMPKKADLYHDAAMYLAMSLNMTKMMTGMTK